MNRIIFLLFLSISLIGNSQTKEYRDMLKKYYDGFPTIDADLALNKVGKKNVYFLDTREKKEYDVSHISGAKYVGYDHFSMDRVKSIPKDAEVIVYCSIGARSQDIGKRLKKAGYTNVKNLYGGLFNWTNHDYRMVNSKGETKTIHGYSSDWSKWVTNGKVVY